MTPGIITWRRSGRNALEYANKTFIDIPLLNRYNTIHLGMTGFDGEGWSWMASRARLQLVKLEQTIKCQQQCTLQRSPHGCLIAVQKDSKRP